jgi:SAM-dependent methyltransferase
VASPYDDELWELVPDEDAPAPSHVLRWVRALPFVDRALDLGCGDGRLTLEVPARHVVGADVSPVALGRARRRAAGREPPVRWKELEPDAPLPLGDGEVELVLCAETVEHVRDVQLLLSEARRVLVPGGRLALSTPAHGRATALGLVVLGWERGFDPLSPHLRFLSLRSLRRLLRDMGFEEEEARRERGTLLVRALRG